MAKMDGFKCENIIFILALSGTCMSTDVNRTNVHVRSHKGRDLLRDLMRNYEKSVRPVEQVDQPIHIAVQLSLQQIMNLDEKNQHFQMGALLTLRWHDDYLIWNPEDYGNITYIPIHSSRIWIPDVTSYNKIEPDTTLVDKGIATVFSTGHVTHTQYAVITTACDIDMTYFPYDEQSCNFSLGSISQGSDFQVLEMEKEDPIDLAYFYHNVEWNLLDVRGENKIGKPREYMLIQRERYCLCERNITSSYVVISIKLKRRGVFYLLALVVPAVQLGLLSMFSYFIPPDEGERIGLGLTTFLSFSVFQLLLAETVPPSSKNYPVVGTILAVLMFFTFIAVCVSVISTSMMLRGPGTGRPHRYITRYIIFGCLARLFCFRDFAYKSLPEYTTKKGKIKICPSKTRLRGGDSNSVNQENEIQEISISRIQINGNNLASSDENTNNKEGEESQRESNVPLVEREWRVVCYAFDRFMFVIHVVALVLAIVAIYKYDTDDVFAAVDSLVNYI